MIYLGHRIKIWALNYVPDITHLLSRCFLEDWTVSVEDKIHETCSNMITVCSDTCKVCNHDSPICKSHIVVFYVFQVMKLRLPYIHRTAWENPPLERRKRKNSLRNHRHHQTYRCYLWLFTSFIQHCHRNTFHICKTCYTSSIPFVSLCTNTTYGMTVRFFTYIT